MPTYVVDTSVALQWFNKSGELHPKEALKLLDDFRTGKIEILIPDILPLELLNALIKGKGLSQEETNTTLKELLKMPIKIVSISLPVLAETSKIMAEYNMAAYDAYFLALAQVENCQLVSADQKAHGQIADGSVVMLKDY